MKALNSIAFVSLSLVAVSGVQADEPVKPQQQPPQAATQQANQWQWVKSRRPGHWQLVQTSLPVSKSSDQAATASSPAKPTENPPVLIEPPRRSLRHRLRWRNSSYSSITISQATAPVSNNVTQPLPHAK